MTFLKHTLRIILLALLCVPFAQAATYYVDNCVVTGNDLNSGTSSTTPWLTVNKVNTSSFNAGDSIFFENTCTWREQLTVPSSGSTGSPITIGPYGYGSGVGGAPPTISGSVLLTSWTSQAGGGTNLTSDPDLRAYWYFENNWNDGTSNGNNLTPGGSPVPTLDSTSGQFIQGAYSASFVGADSDVASVADTSLSNGFAGKTGSLNTSMTIGCWAYSSLTNTTQGVMNKGAQTGYGFVFRSTGHIQFMMYLDGANQEITSNATYTPNTWYHLVGRLNASGNLMDFWVNGVQQTSTYTATTALVATTASPLRIGYDTVFGYLTGLMDECFVFNRALTNTEIGSVYAHGLNGTRNSATLYYASASTQPNQVFRDSVRLTQVTATSALVTGSWYWDGTNVWVYDNPTGHIIEASQRTSAIIVQTSNITVQGMHLTETNGAALPMTENAGGLTTITGNTIDRAYYQGIYPAALESSPYTAEISYNTISLCGGSGIEINNYDVSITVEHNTIFSNGSLYSTTDPILEWVAGVREVGRALLNVLVQYNVIYSNGPSVTTANAGNGVWFDSTLGANVVVRYNLIYGNTANGIMFENLSGGLAYGNVVYSNGLAGVYLSNSSGASTDNKGNAIYNNTLVGNSAGNFGAYGGVSAWGYNGLAGSCTNNIIENNIVVSSGNNHLSLSAFRGCSNDGTYGSGNVYAYNDFGPAVSNFIQWGVNSGTYYSTYSAWETATGNCGTTRCSHSVQSAPTFANSSAGQFWLKSGSPGIDAGTNLGSPYNIGLLPASSWPNLVFTGDQNSYGTGWEVGAYIFTGQTVQGVLSGGPTIGGLATIK